MSLIIVQTTCNSKVEAKDIATVLLKEKLCACVQISEVDSFYVYKGEFCNDKEYLLNIKSKKKHFKKMKSRIKELHSYDLPEIISIKIDECTKEYKNFIKENTK